MFLFFSKICVGLFISSRFFTIMQCLDLVNFTRLLAPDVFVRGFFCINKMYFYHINVLVILFQIQSARYLLNQKNISVDTKENECHDSKNNDLIQSVRSLDQNKYHHNNRSNPHKSSHLFSGSSESEESMVKMRIVAFEGTFFHDKNSP